MATRDVTNEGFSYPQALLRKLFVSGSDRNRWFLDGFVNSCMSGGPVFTMNRDTPMLIGVETSRRQELNQVTLNGQQTGVQLSANAGIVFATRIQYAMELISWDPIGLPIG